MDYPNIVITVPRMNIGNGVSKNHPKVAKHMMGSVTSMNIAYLNNILPMLLKKDSNLNRNIYLLTSERDYQYPTEILPFLDDYRKYSNFNLVKTYSSFVREHNQVTAHHTSLLLGLYYLLANEVVPKYTDNEVDFFGKQLHSNPNPSKQPYVDLREFNVKEDILYIGGIALLKGCDFAEYDDGRYNLVLENVDGSGVHKIPLAKKNSPRLTKDMFDGEYLTNYDKAVFTTPKYQGISIADVPKGKYILAIEIIMTVGIRKNVRLVDMRSKVSEFSTDKYSLKKTKEMILFEIF